MDIYNFFLTEIFREKGHSTFEILWNTGPSGKDPSTEYPVFSWRSVGAGQMSRHLLKVQIGLKCHGEDPPFSRLSPNVHQCPACPLTSKSLREFPLLWRRFCHRPPPRPPRATNRSVYSVRTGKRGPSTGCTVDERHRKTEIKINARNT